MKKKIALLGLISALTIGASLGFTACGDSEVAEHDHVYDGGTVTTESTCFKEGVRTYHCTVEGCEQTKTAPIAKIAHSWDGGEITKDATCSAEGVKTYICTVESCNGTKEEPIEKTDHSYGEGVITKAPDFLTKGKKTYKCLNCDNEKVESVEAHSDFAEQFYTALTGQNNWYYGYMNSFDANTGADNFVQVRQNEDGVWKDGEIEVGKGYISGDNAAIAYRFSQNLPEKIQTNVSVSFSGAESATRLDAYLIINGECVETITENTKDWSYETKEAIDISQDDTFCIVFKNAGEGKASGNLSVTFTAPCVHIWDNGKVTKEATCTAEGKKQYSCVSCDKTYTETLDKIPHSWNSGEVTLEPTDTYAGTKTYTCTTEGCGNTYTEVLPKIGKGADFRHEFTSGNQNGAWSYGHSDYSWDGGESFTYAAFDNFADDGAWKSDKEGSAQIKNDWLDVGWGDGVKNATIAYTSEYALTAKYSITFTGGMPNTRVITRVGIKDKSGKLKDVPVGHWAGKENKDWEIDAEVTLDEGDIIYFIFFDEHGDLPEGWANGNINIVINEVKTVHEFNGANFAEDFELNESGEFSGWQLGVVDYHWADENFDFNKITAHNGNGDAYHSDSPWMDIKGDWMAVNGMMGFAYRFTSDADVYVDFKLNAVAEDGKFSLRWAIKDKDGNIKNANGQAQFVKGGHDITFNQDISVVEGDVLYLLVNKDEGADQNTFELTLTDKNQEPAPEFNGADFAEDFELNESGEFNGWLVGVVDYHWADENFDFTKISVHNGNGDAYHSDSPWMDIQGDWMAVNGMMGFAYCFSSDADVNVYFKLNAVAEDGKFSLRWAIKDKGGNIKNENGKAQWGADGHDIVFNQKITVVAGDVLYLLVNKDEGGDQNRFELKLIKVRQETDAKIADFGEAFDLASNGEFANWQIGAVDYHWSSETFDFTKITALNDNGDAYHSDSPFMEIKGDWLASKDMVGIAYTFEEGMSAKFNLTVTCKGDSESAIRWAVKDSSGSIRDGGKAKWGGSGNSVTLGEDVTVEEGDVLYILIGHEKGDSDQKEFTLSIEKKAN